MQTRGVQPSVSRLTRRAVKACRAGARFAMAIAVLLLQAQPAISQTGCRSIFMNTQLEHPYNLVPAAGAPVALSVDEQPLGSLTYRPAFGGAGTFTLDEYLGKFCTTGFLVLHRNKIVYERYLQGTTPETAFLSASMSKTILALLYGVAVSEHKLALDERIPDILPDFADSAFADDTVDDLLRMASGANLRQSLEAGVESDNTAVSPLAVAQVDVREYLRSKSERRGLAKQFHYSGAVTAVLGLALRERTGQTNAAYLSEKIWTPMGASSPAYWLKNVHEQEGVQGYFVARLRDYARLGLLVMNQGSIAGRQIVSAHWIEQMTSLTPGKPQPGRGGYGLHIWLAPNSPGTSYFAGAGGQFIFVNPGAQVVIVHTGNSPGAEFSGGSHLFGLRDAIFKVLGGQ